MLQRNEVTYIREVTKKKKSRGRIWARCDNTRPPFIYRGTAHTMSPLSDTEYYKGVMEYLQKHIENNFKGIEVTYKPNEDNPKGRVYAKGLHIETH